MAAYNRVFPAPPAGLDNVRALAVVVFLGGLLLAVRVMFFGVRRRVTDEEMHHRRWPLALAAFLAVSGALLYGRSVSAGGVTASWVATVVLIGLAAGFGAWWLVKRSADSPSSDPEDDPRYRFQGHVARVIRAIGAEADNSGLITFSFDGKRFEFEARWSSSEPGWESDRLGVVESEVVIERIEGDVAYVEPWTVVEERL